MLTATTGTAGIQSGFDKLTRNAAEIANLLRTDSASSAQTSENAQTGVTPEQNDGSIGSIAPTESSERLNELLIQQRKYEQQIGASAMVMQSSNKMFNYLLENM